MAEALNGTYKAELIRRAGPWRTRAQAEFATIEWIDWCNTARLHGEIGHVPPAEHEALWHAQNPPATMALTHQPRLHQTRGGSLPRDAGGCTGPIRARRAPKPLLGKGFGAVRPLGFEPRTCGLRVRCSAVELEAQGGRL